MFIVFGISLFIGGIIGVLISHRIRMNNMTNYYTSNLYPIVKADGDVRFTPFGILINNTQKEEA